MMLATRKNSTVTGLEIEAGSIAATELRQNGTVEIAGAGIVGLEPGAVNEGEIQDSKLVQSALKRLFSENKLSKSVRLGIANQRVVVRTLRLPAIEDKEELETAIRFQAQDEVPMPLDAAVLDYRVVGRSQSEDGARQMEVVVVAARRDMLSPFIEVMRGAGLKPAGIDLSAFGMIRVLARENGRAEAESPEEGAPPSAKLFCHLGDLTNLAVARGLACLFSRASTFGLEEVSQRLAQKRGLTVEHARQWIDHVGLNLPLEQIDGDPETVTMAREVLEDGASRIVDELRLSLEFYGAQEGSLPVDGVVVCGPGTLIAGLPELIQGALGGQVETVQPQSLAHLDSGSAARLTLPYGLALEK